MQDSVARDNAFWINIIIIIIIYLFSWFEIVWIQR